MWNYRIVRDTNYDNEYPLSIREVYYDGGEPFLIGQEPLRFTEGTVFDIEDTLKAMLKAVSKPIIDITDFNSTGGKYKK